MNVSEINYKYNFPTRRINSGFDDGTFAEALSEAASADENSKIDEYMKYLSKKYGNVTIKSVGKDKESLDRIAKTMSGNDVVIAPNIFEEMADDPEKAAYYEEKIDYFFNVFTPQATAYCKSIGLVFEPCGVVVHEDGSVTYICGCSDSPERVAKVNAINRAKRDRQQQMLDMMGEYSLERAMEELQRISGAGAVSSGINLHIKDIVSTPFSDIGGMLL